MVRAAAVAVVLPLAACGDLLQVDSPGRIVDEDLASKDAIPGMIVGMKYDLSQAVDATQEFLALAAVELWHGGSYDWSDIPRGIITEEDIGGEWNSPQQARWVAETGVERIRDFLDAAEFGRSPAVAQAYVYAGYANRILGENFCSSVIDGGPEIPNTEHFTRAEGHFTQAITIGQAAGRADLVNAGYAGRASVRAYAGDWAGAASDAAQVPSGFEYFAEIDTEMRNEIVYETHNRFEYTVWGTYMEAAPGDARAPWQIMYDDAGQIANGANGSTPHYQQRKYTSNSDDVALSKGTEMLMIRAEAELRINGAGGIAAAYGHMNAARAEYGMAALTPALDLPSAWAELRFERGATLWLEGRRFGDLRRWYNEGAGSPAYDASLEGRATCMPISRAERLSNPNLRG
ncbi:MAG: RagB/SusD family nutrient uptake outer membrane protein [Gemmatimonadota bacterium]|nr:RagB/SusD family nutrient uptake outer membrane protein [Gemmatimonadota bacterium]